MFRRLSENLDSDAAGLLTPGRTAAQIEGSTHTIDLSRHPTGRDLHDGVSNEVSRPPPRRLSENLDSDAAGMLTPCRTAAQIEVSTNTIDLSRHPTGRDPHDDVSNEVSRPPPSNPRNRSSRSLALAAIVSVVLAGCASVREPVVAPNWAASHAATSLSHVDCVELALHAAPTAAAWEARRRLAQARVAEASAFPNPNLGLTWEQIGLGSVAPVEQTVSLFVALDQVLSRPGRTRVAEQELTATEASLLAERRKLAAAVCRSYDALVAMRARVDLRRQQVAIAARSTEVIRRFVEVGLEPRISIDRSEAEHRQALVDLARTSASARAMEIAFAFTLGFERPVELQLSESMTQPISGVPGDLDAALAEARATRHELVAVDAEYAAQLERLHIRAVRLQFLPTVGAGYRSAGGTSSAVASVDMPLPLFDRGDPARAEEEAALLATAASVRQVALGIAAEVSESLERLQSAQIVLEQHDRSLAALRESLREGAEQTFREGESDFQTLILARRDEVEARLSLLDSELEVASARIALRDALGRLP